MIYRYQIQIILHYSRGKTRQMFTNATKANWKKQLEDVEAENQQIKELVGSMFESQTARGLKEVDERLENATKIQEKTLLQVQVSYSLGAVFCYLTGDRMRINRCFSRNCPSLIMLFLTQ